MASDGNSGQRYLDKEAIRQAAVFASGVLGMSEHPRLRSIVERAADLLKVPVAAISVVDGDRQWFPAMIGLESDETARDLSFCAHAIMTPERTMVVPDATEDPRFAANSLVTGSPKIRFYAGVPIVTAGRAALGAICAIDHEPRAALSSEEEATLRSLAQEAAEEIDKIENVRRYGSDASEMIVEQMRQAMRQQDEPLVLELDRVLQDLEKKLTPRSNKD